jgi:hypothetical protein
MPTVIVIQLAAPTRRQCWHWQAITRMSKRNDLRPAFLDLTWAPVAEVSFSTLVQLVGASTGSPCLD